MTKLKASIALGLLASALSLGACAPTSRFEWGNYEGSLYAYSKKPSTLPQYRAALETAIAKGRSSNRVAPGLQAELGYVLLEDGDRAGALKLFEAEMHDFPESRAFLQGVTARISGAQTKTEPKAEVAS